MSVKNADKFINRGLWGGTIALFSLTALIFMVTGESFLYSVSGEAQKFLFGVFGYFAFPLFSALFAFGLMLIFVKREIGGSAKITAAFASLALIFFAFILHLAFSTPSEDFSAYIESCYLAGFSEKATIGGVIAALAVYPLAHFTTLVGAYFILVALAVICLIVVFRKRVFASKPRSGKDEVTGVYDSPKGREDIDGYEEVGGRNRVSGFGGSSKSPTVGKRKLAMADSPFEFREEGEYEKERSAASEKLYPEREGNPASVYSEEYDRAFNEKRDYVRSSMHGTEQNGYENSGANAVYNDNLGQADEDIRLGENVYIPDDYREDNYRDRQDFGESASVSPEEVDIENGVDESAADEGVRSFSFDSDEGDTEDVGDGGRMTESVVPEPQESVPEPPRFYEREERPSVKPKPQPEKKVEEAVNPYDMMPLNFKYVAPPIKLLKVYENNESYADVERFMREKGDVILSTLKVLGGINAEIADVVHGPTVTRFALRIPLNVSVKSVVKYVDDLKLQLKATSDIRIAQIPGTSYLGIEVPNDKQATVGLREVIESKPFINAKPNSLTFAIGKDIIGNAVVSDIVSMPHLLIAGATGTGKSVGLNSLIVSLMYKYSPADLRFIIIDPKQVEFTIFKGIPHMLFDEIISEPNKAVAVLNWAVREMEARYTKLCAAMVRNIDEYNAQIDPTKEKRMPRIVIIVDEFADLMQTDKKNIESAISRIAAKARASGVCLILATQRPSVDIMVGSIKTNFPSRMAFKMSNAVDSNTILNEQGAETLLGKGDVLFRTTDHPQLTRAQGAFVSLDEIKTIVDYIKAHNKCYFNEFALASINNECNPQAIETSGFGGGGKGAVSKDNLAGLYLAIQLGAISISMIQRRLRFGFPKSAGIVDWMEREGYIVKGNGKQNQVLMTKEQYDEKYGDMLSDEEFSEKYDNL